MPLDPETRAEILSLARRWSSLVNFYINWDERKVVSGDPDDALRSLGKLVDEAHDEYVAACHLHNVCTLVTCWTHTPKDRCDEHVGQVSGKRRPPPGA